MLLRCVYTEKKSGAVSYKVYFRKVLLFSGEIMPSERNIETEIVRHVLQSPYLIRFLLKGEEVDFENIPKETRKEVKSIIEEKVSQEAIRQKAIDISKEAHFFYITDVHPESLKVEKKGKSLIYSVLGEIIFSFELNYALHGKNFIEKDIVYADVSCQGEILFSLKGEVEKTEKGVLRLIFKDLKIKKIHLSECEVQK